MKNPVVITTKQAKKQVNHFGRALLLYILLFMALRYGMPYISEYAPFMLFGMDPELAMLVYSSVLMLFLALIPFNIASLFLKLNIRDYLKNPRLRSDRVFALNCIGIVITLTVTSMSTLFYFFFHTQGTAYSFLGNFSTNEAIYKNLAYFVFFVIVKPICDEYIFRGIIQRQLGHYGRYFGVLGSTVLYAIAQTNLVDAVPGFALGWFLALITLRYHSIRPAIQVHMAVSLVLFALNVIPGNYLWVVTVVILLIYILAGLFLFQKRVDTGMVRYGATEWKLWKILLTSLSIVMCIALFIVNVVLSLQI
ncbi:MAG: CPBP family intramembrane metalloprotease [Solobacterium sp.]|nr:CPBP family intramembrane metalloprotease [Solobacterium sp.]